MNKMNLFFIISSILIFGLSLTQNAYTTDFAGGTKTTSRLALLTGWLGIIGFQAVCLSWLANPLLIVTWILQRNQSKYALYTSILALILMISFLFFKKIMVNEAGHYGNIISYHLGYGLWLTSGILMVIASIFGRR